MSSNGYGLFLAHVLALALALALVLAHALAVAAVVAALLFVAAAAAVAVSFLQVDSSGSQEACPRPQARDLGSPAHLSCHTASHTRIFSAGECHA